MAKKKACFNWKCPHCQYRNKVMLNMEFEMPCYYSVTWKCNECGKESKLEWNLTVNGWHNQRKPPKLRKRKKGQKEEQEDYRTQKDRIYRNDHGNHKTS